MTVALAYEQGRNYIKSRQGPEFVATPLLEPPRPQCLRQSGTSASLWGVNHCWLCGPAKSGNLSWKARSLLTVRAGWGGRGQRRGIITKHAADCSGTKAALTSSLLVASKGQSCSERTPLTRTTSHHSWGAETSCSITRHETDFFQLQWTGHKPRLTTSSAQTEQDEDGWARTEDKCGIGVEGWEKEGAVRAGGRAAEEHTLNKLLFTAISSGPIDSHNRCWSFPAQRSFRSTGVNL